MTIEEISLLKHYIIMLKPKKCLGWGTEYSTLYFTRFLQKGSEWMSIEHDKEWAENISNKAKRKSNIKIYHVSYNHHP